jgi:hypothetical protein
MHPDGRWHCCKPETAEADQDPSHHAVIVDEASVGPASRHSAISALSENLNHSRDNGGERQELNGANPGGPLPGFGGLALTHVWGSLILFAAVLLALCPAFYAIADPDFFIYADTIPTRTAVNTLFYVSSCIPAAASQLYKEHIFLQYKQPVNMDRLNLLLSIFQFIFASIVSPLAYGLQGLGGRGQWTEQYPNAQFSGNFVDALRCFFGLLDEEDQLNKYYEEAKCHLTYGLVLLHAFSIIAVGVAVDKIVNAGATKVMYRGISAGIILAVLSMHFYDMNTPDFNYGPAIDGLNLVCLVLLILGAEVYHRESIQESTFETVYPHVEVPNFDDYE